MDSTTSNGIKANKGSAPKYFADAAGNYLGGWADMPCPIAGAVEVSMPPLSADQKRVGSVWMPTANAVAPSAGSNTQAGANVSAPGASAAVTTNT